MRVLLSLLSLLCVAHALQCQCGPTLADGIAPPDSASFNRPVVFVTVPGRSKASDGSYLAKTIAEAQNECFQMAQVGRRWYGTTKSPGSSVIECDGFVAAPDSSRYQVYYYYLNAQIPAGNGFVAGSFWDADGSAWARSQGLSAYTVYTVDRLKGFACFNSTFDPYYYYFQSGHRAEIEATYCPFPSRNAGPAGCCYRDPGSWTNCNPTSMNPDGNIPSQWAIYTPSRTEAGDDASLPWARAALSYWMAYGKYFGHAPNGACPQSPSGYDPQYSCGRPRLGCSRPSCNCSTTPLCTDLPCSGQGYCSETPPASDHPDPYYCDCMNYGQRPISLFPGDYINSQPRFSGTEMYYGYACQFPTINFCKRQDAMYPYMCGLTEDHGTRCLPTITTIEDTCPIKNWLPQCDCTGLSTMGTYCDQSRCLGPTGVSDPYACQVRGASQGQCLLQGGSTWKCECASTSVGTLCEQDASPCIMQCDQCQPDQCTRNGVCRPAGITTGSDLQNVNYNATTPWCNCTRELAYGKYCQYTYCYTSQVVMGHGQCALTNGMWVSDEITCYAPYRSSSATVPPAHCDVDICAAYHGIVVTVPPSPTPNSCDCLDWVQRFSSSNDITCWPKCPVAANGLECGGAPNTCGCTSGSGAFPPHYCTCSCSASDGYIATTVLANSSYNVPPAQTTDTCELFCQHGGTLPAGTNYLDPSTWVCTCPANSGWSNNIGLGYRRCDYNVCRNNGTWSTALGHCICVGPYTYQSYCVNSACDSSRTPSFLDGALAVDPADSWRRICACNIPMTSTDLSHAWNCDGDICGQRGALLTTLNSATPVASRCTCTGLYQTDALLCSNSSCPYCQKDPCLHGGAINPLVPTQCLCPFMWQDGGLCAAHRCGPHGYPSPDGTSCVCTDSFTDTFCTTPPTTCQNGGYYDVGLGRCVCPPMWDDGNLCVASQCGAFGTPSANGYSCICTNNYSGTSCEIPPAACQHGGVPHPSSPASYCDCPFAWTGTLCETSVCGSHGTPSVNGLSCVCSGGYTGALCTIPPIVPASSSSSSSTGAAAPGGSSSTGSVALSSTGSLSSSTGSLSSSTGAIVVQPNITCQHGGYPSPSAPKTTCVCLTAWSGAVCNISRCGVHGTPSPTGLTCICQTGWTGLLCDVAVASSSSSSTGAAQPSVSSSTAAAPPVSPPSAASSDDGVNVALIAGAVGGGVGGLLLIGLLIWWYRRGKAAPVTDTDQEKLLQPLPAGQYERAHYYRRANEAE